MAALAGLASGGNGYDADDADLTEIPQMLSFAPAGRSWGAAEIATRGEFLAGLTGSQ
jgi:hypothetical protein